MKVGAIVAEKGRAVISAPPEATIRDAAQVLDANKIGAVLIMDDDGAIRGVLSERDITREIARRGAAALDAPVTTAMTGDVVTVGPELSVDEAMRLMSGRRFRHLPVVDAGQLCGIVSIGDVVQRKIAQAEAEAAAMKEYIHS